MVWTRGTLAVRRPTIMELFEELEEASPSFIAKQNMFVAVDTNSRPEIFLAENGISRRWIWVHHIKNTDRRKNILKEAGEGKLGGYLKHGYPGIIVIEGPRYACDEFVSWVKGNKSRPGGFGRNWDHHVRGQVDLDNDASRSLPCTFEEFEDMTLLGSLCQEHELEDEFLEFVMQHKRGD